MVEIFRFFYIFNIFLLYMLSYQNLLYRMKKCIKRNYLVIKKNYFIIMMPDFDYHITVFHLFHISENKMENKCSKFYWCSFDLKIKEIPSEKFIYNQHSHDMYKSTRNMCVNPQVDLIIKYFQKILDISEKVYKN